MTERGKNIVAAIVCIFIPLVYFLGVVCWKKMQFSEYHEVVAKGKHIYFVCFSSALYAASAVIVLLAKPNWLKLIAATVNSICAIILYQEIRYGNKQWSEWSWWLLIIVPANYFVFYCIVERYKKSINYGK